MYKSQKDIDDWVRAFNKREIKRMTKDDPKNPASYEDLDFRGGGEWGLEVFVPQAILDLLPEEERENWWEVDPVIDEDGQGFCQDEEEMCEEYGLKEPDDMNPVFCRRFYTGLPPEDQDWWSSLEVEIKGKTGQPFEEVRWGG